MNVFKMALDRMKRRGWTQGVRHDHQTGCSCLLGCFEKEKPQYADKAEIVNCVALALLADKIENQYKDRLYESRRASHRDVDIIEGFNDHGATNQNDCENLLAELVQENP